MRGNAPRLQVSESLIFDSAGDRHRQRRRVSERTAVTQFISIDSVAFQAEID